MKYICEYCERPITDTDEECPNCGAANPHLKRTAAKIPSTIAELKAFCNSRTIPLEKMHFHIGEDYKEPKAFGIYKDENTGNFVVYKNKADGSRAVRYEGKDEAYAVNEIFQKLKTEIYEEKAFRTNVDREYADEQKRIEKRRASARGSKIVKWVLWIYAGFFAVALIISILVAIFGQKSGYYKYGDTLYYYRSGDWYYYDTSYNDWYSTTVDDELSDNYKDYYESSSYDSSYGGSDYTSSSSYYDNYYDSDNNYDDDWDDDDWDTDWDSGYDSDWDSDW